MCFQPPGSGLKSENCLVFIVIFSIFVLEPSSFETVASEMNKGDFLCAVWRNLWKTLRGRSSLSMIVL